jgi:hypothetical protein
VVNLPDTINYALVFVFISAAVYAIVLRESPKALKHLAVWALARALAIEQFRSTREQESKRWTRRLGIAPQPERVRPISLKPVRHRAAGSGE